MTVQARWNGTVLAESDDTIVVEGNHYFPPDALRKEHFTKTRFHTICPWKGIASYYTVTIDEASYRNAAWYYPSPFPLARKLRNRVAFWPGVEIVEVTPRTGP